MYPRVKGCYFLEFKQGMLVIFGYLKHRLAKIQQVANLICGIRNTLPNYVGLPIILNAYWNLKSFKGHQLCNLQNYIIKFLEW